MNNSGAAPAIEHVSCDYCGLDDTGLLFVENGFNTVKCRNCGLIYLNPRPTEVELVAGYEKEYFDTRRDRESVQLRNAKRQLDILMAHLAGLEHAWNPPRLLEVGSALGTFLKVSSDSNIHVTGVDVSEHACDYARERYGVSVICGVVEELNLPAESYDVVAFSDVLSHVRSPRKFFNEISRILRPNGLMFARVGDKGGIWKLYRRGKWSAPEHLYHFTRSMVYRYMEDAGIEKVKTYPAFDSAFPSFRNLLSPRYRMPYLALAAGDLVARRICRAVGLTEDYYLVAKRTS